MIPTEHGPSVLIDAGANAEARPEHLLQFGHMGSIFAEEVLGIERPARAAALDRRGAREGEPARRSTPTRCSRRARSTSRATSRAARCSRASADVIVCDGFTGNVALKTLEGTIRSLLARAALGARVDDAREARRPPDPAGGEQPAGAARPRDDGRRLPPRPARDRRDRPRLELARRDLERDRSGRPRHRARHRRPLAADSAGARGRVVALNEPVRHNERLKNSGTVP